MSRNARFWLIICLSPLLLFAKCVRDPEFKGVEKLTFLGQDSLGVAAELQVGLYNPNRISLTVRDVDAQIFVFGRYLGHCTLKDKFIMPQKDIAHPVVVVHVQPDSLLALLPQLLSADSAELTLDGVFKLQKGVPFKMRRRSTSYLDFRGGVESMLSAAMPKDMFRVRSVMPSGFSLKETKLNMKVSVTNPLSMTFALDSLQFDLFANQQAKPFGVWKMARPTELAPNTVQELEALVVINNAKAFTDFLLAVFQEKIIRTEGFATMRCAGYTFTVPLKQAIGLGK